MANPAGSFIWYELMTPDPDAMAPFYGAVLGWTISAADCDNPAAGLPHDSPHRRQLRWRRPPPVAGHAATRRQAALDRLFVIGGCRWPPSAIVADGGKVLMPAPDLPSAASPWSPTPGRALLPDEPVPPPGGRTRRATCSTVRPQHVNWNELASPDLRRRRRSTPPLRLRVHRGDDHGPMGDYCFIDHHGLRLGGVMQRQDDRQPAAWLFYFGVPSIAAATRAIKANGGTVLGGTARTPDQRVDCRRHRSGRRGVRTVGA